MTWIGYLAIAAAFGFTVANHLQITRRLAAAKRRAADAHAPADKVGACSMNADEFEFTPEETAAFEARAARAARSREGMRRARASIDAKSGGAA